MTAVTTSTTGVTVASASPNCGAVVIIVETPVMSQATGDTFAIDIATYGGKTFLAHQSYVQTTANSIDVAEVATSAVTSNTTVTITVPAGNDGVKRTLIIYAFS